MRRIAFAILRVVDLVAAPAVVAAAWLLRTVRRVGLGRMPVSRAVLRFVGVLPIRDHYYEPLINARHLRHDLDRQRSLPGIDLAIDQQLARIAHLATTGYACELADVIRSPKPGEPRFDPRNLSFGPGDADVLYAIIRDTKPRCLIEIGSGYSTIVAHLALAANARETSGPAAHHLCIEPYEMPWLEALGADVRRQRVEQVDPATFDALGAGDILFVDSSHVLRPQGDVVTEYLEIMPRLHAGELVHVHDIFTPRDYPARWLFDQGWLWNEQYMLEALLTGGTDREVIASLNHLWHDHFDVLKQACPLLSRDVPPGSFWIRRRA